MRKFFASLGVLCIASVASAQVVTLTPMNQFGYEDGVGEIAWKLGNPSGSMDWFNVDFGSDFAGSTAAAVWADFASTGLGGISQMVGYTQSSLGSGAPDLSGASMKAAAVPASDGFNSDTGYGISCIDPGTDFHVLAQLTNGDTETWLVSDTNGPVQGRSFFSSTSYGAGQNGGIGNLRMGFAGWTGSLDGSLLLNGGSTATVDNQSETCITFTACASGVQSVLYLISPIVIGPLVPVAISTTGAVGGPCSNQWTLCTTLTCGITPIAGLQFQGWYSDPCSIKPNGKNEIKASSIATLNINQGPTCGGCYGQKDDGSLDAYVWKVSSVAGSGDWFNVNHGLPTGGTSVTSLTGIQLASHDFCGFGPTWAEVGVYLDDGSGNPIVTGGNTSANPTMAPGAGDGTYPATMYDITDIPVGGTGWHVAAKWPNGDTCIWLGSDTDGVDSSCGTPIPNTNSDSAFSGNDYTTASNGFTAANWMMKIDWN